MWEINVSIEVYLCSPLQLSARIYGRENIERWLCVRNLEWTKLSNLDFSVSKLTRHRCESIDLGIFSFNTWENTVPCVEAYDVRFISLDLSCNTKNHERLFRQISYGHYIVLELLLSTIYELMYCELIFSSSYFLNICISHLFEQTSSLRFSSTVCYWNLCVTNFAYRTISRTAFQLFTTQCLLFQFHG